MLWDEERQRRIQLRGLEKRLGERGIQSFDTALYKLVQDGRVELDEALNHADSRANLEAKINFG